MELTFWFDPGCPWTWITSRWIVEVAPRRDLRVTWRSFSLAVANAPLPEEWRTRAEAWHGSLRVVEAVRSGYGDEAVGRLYTELGARIHHDGDVELKGLADALEAVGVDPGYARRAGDDALDEPILASMDEARRAAGDDVGAPLLRLGPPGRPAHMGPVLSPAPTGDAALRLFDGFAAVVAVDGFFELKRGRDVAPQFGPRPA